MKLNRAVIMQAIIEEKDYFFNFLDYINLHDTGGEIPQKMYQHFYTHRVIKQLSQDPLKQHYRNLFDTRSMLDNGIFHEVKITGHYAFNSLVIDLLGFLDTKRSKQLYDIEFESLRQSTFHYGQKIQSALTGSDDQFEAIAGFKNLLNEILTKVRENHYVLEGKVQSFAAEYSRYEAGQSSHSIQDLFQQVDHLFHRNIKPFLDFTTTEKIVAGGSFTDTLDQVIEYLDSEENFALARFFSFRKTAISSYYKDVQKTAVRVRHLLYQLQQDQSNYLAIESGFQVLIDSLEPLRHGKVKNVRLKPDIAVFQPLHTFNGLANHKQKYSKRLSLKPDDNLSRFEWHLERLSEKSLSKKFEPQQPLPANHYVQLERKQEIVRAVYAISRPEKMSDLILELHLQLERRLAHYSLLDFLYAFEVWLPLLQGFTQGTPLRSRIQDDTYYFDYSILKYEK